MQFNFNAQAVAPAVPHEIVPAGWYNIAIVGSELAENSNKNGTLLNLTMTIIDGEHRGRKLFDRLNVAHTSAMAQEIGLAALSAICHATGVLQMQDTRQLHNIPLQAKVVVRPAETGADGKQYEARNEIKGYRAPQPITPPVAQPVTMPGGFNPQFQQQPAPAFNPQAQAQAPAFQQQPAPAFAQAAAAQPAFAQQAAPMNTAAAAAPAANPQPWLGNGAAMQDASAAAQHPATGQNFAAPNAGMPMQQPAVVHHAPQGQPVDNAGGQPWQQANAPVNNPAPAGQAAPMPWMTGQ